jgi:hypothetical protein
MHGFDTVADVRWLWRSLLVVLMSVLPGGVARAEVSDGGAQEGLVLEVQSGVVTLPSGAVRSIDAGVYLDEVAAVRSARELAALRAGAAAPREAAPSGVGVALVVTAAVCFAGGVALGFFVR